MGFLILLSCARFEEIRPTAPVKDVTVEGAALELVRGTRYGPGEGRFFDDAGAQNVNEGALKVRLISPLYRLTAGLDTPLSRAYFTFDIKITVWNSGSGLRAGFLTNGPGTLFTGVEIRKSGDTLVTLMLRSGADSVRAGEYRLSEYSGSWATYSLLASDGIVELREGVPGSAAYARRIRLPLSDGAGLRTVTIERLSTPVEFSLDNVFLYR